MRPQAHIQAQAKDRVLQRRTTLRDEEPLNLSVNVERHAINRPESSSRLAHVRAASLVERPRMFRRHDNGVIDGDRPLRIHAHHVAASFEPPRRIRIDVGGKFDDLSNLKGNVDVDRLNRGERCGS